MKSPHAKLDKCQNCQHPLDDDANFCPNCGQKALPDYLSVRYFISEFLNNYFSFDSKFVNTIRPLLFKPAFLSLEFIEGRRIRYINPVQLFIFISFLYFLTDSILLFKEDPEDVSYVNINRKETDTPQDSLSTPADSLSSGVIDSTTASKDIILFSDDATSPVPDSLKDARRGWVKTLLERSQRFNKLDKAEQTERVNKAVSYLVFILMPVFALLLGLFFRKGKRHFLESLIFSLHFHAFYFLAATFFILIDRLLPEDIDSIILFIILAIYLFFGLRRFYGYKGWPTGFRMAGLSVLYLMIVMVGFIVSIIISVII